MEFLLKEFNQKVDVSYLKPGFFFVNLEGKSENNYFVFI